MQKIKKSWVYTGSIENGMDLMRIGEWFLSYRKERGSQK
jgi:hypothetical protein